MATPTKYCAVMTLVAAGLALLPCISASADPNQAIAILKNRCFSCHGATQQRNGLRLDTLDHIERGGDALEPAFVPGKSAASLLVKRITSDDPAYRMPFGKPALSDREVAVLVEWIDAGGKWPNTPDTQQPEVERHPHWAFNAPERIEPPKLEEDDRAVNAIDAFIIDRAREHDLTPSEEADKYTLVRRLYLELVGLPPSREEVRDFVNDHSDDAYEALVDRLLASPHYGERQARRWLDLARYADTNGYEKDRDRSIWPYRDWVINAFNDNMPFDQFAIEQLAGDLLPDATESQRIATGFHRNAMLNEEGGIDAAEDRFKRTVDRTNTTSTAFLGLTMACAQCHTHKLDPITRTEYYEFFAFLNNTDEAFLRLKDPAVASKRERAATLADDMNDWISWLGQRDPKIQNSFAAWQDAERKSASEWYVPKPLSYTSENGATLNLQEDASILAEGDVPNDDTYVIDLEMGTTAVTAIRLEVLPHESLPGGGPGRGTILAEGDFLLTAFEVAIIPSSPDKEPVPVEIASATQDYATENKPASLALDDLGDTGWSVNGALAKPHRAVFQLKEPLQLGGDSTLRITLKQNYIHQHTIGRFRLSLTSDADHVIASAYPAHIEAILAQAPDVRTDADSKTLEHFYYREVAEPLQQWRENRDKIRKRAPEFETTLVLTPREPERDTHVYNRGEFLSPRRLVTPNVPSILPPLPEGEPLDRLTLAKWLVDRNNPLTARVTMNRLWQQVFGRGIVSTPDDFGVEGDRPTHPELLDWLATEFMDRGWDLKAMHKLMVMSATFRQDSTVTPEQLEIDAENIWLARGPRFRLDAEVIRDLALTASGLLTPTIGGPSVYPPQPAGVTDLAYGSPGWPEASGEDRYRRGLYTYMKRTAPYAGFMVFDAPNPEVSCVRRIRTNTPLQALTLLNDPVYMEAAQAMATRVMERDGMLSKKIDYLFMTCLSRQPDKIEREQIRSFFDQMTEHFNAHTNDAKQLHTEFTPTDPDAALRWTAWVAVCRVVLNLDETITRG